MINLKMKVAVLIIAYFGVVNISGECLSELTAQSGDIKSPGYPNATREPIDGCTWHITVEPGQRVHLQVMERDFRCNVANLTLDLRLAASVQLCYKWMPTEPQKDHYSSSNEASVYCLKHQSEPLRGFWIKYEATGCAYSGLPSDMIVNNKPDVYDNGSLATMTCPDGKHLASGAEEVVWSCQENNQWMGAKDNCLPDSENATLPPRETTISTAIRTSSMGELQSTEMTTNPKLVDSKTSTSSPSQTTITSIRTSSMDESPSMEVTTNPTNKSRSKETSTRAISTSPPDAIHGVGAKFKEQDEGNNSEMLAGTIVGVLLVVLIAAVVAAVLYKRHQVPENKPDRFENPLYANDPSAQNCEVGLSFENQAATYQKDNN